MKTWTNEQIDAIYSKWCDENKSESSNILVNAAAGSGKTAVLVERIVHKLCCDINSPDYCDIKNLLVVTFTNAAAKEMKQRISDALNETLAKAINDNDFEFVERLKNQIKNINSADITTIDAFCLKVVKNNFHLLNIDPDFKIADSAECEMIKDEIIEELFEDEYQDSNFIDIALKLSDSRDISTLGNIVRSLYDYTRSLPRPDEWLLEKKELLLSNNENNIFFATVKKDIMQKINSARKHLIIALRYMIRESIPVSDRLTEKKIFEIISKYPPEQENEIYYRFGTYYTAIYNEYIFCRNMKSLSWDEMNEILGTFSFIRLNSAPKFKDKELLIKDKDKLEPLKYRRDTAKELISDATGLICGTVSEICDISINELYPMIDKLVDLCLKFGERYNKIKQDRNILEFSDIEHLCLKVINDNEDIRDMMKEKYSEILIDEYQDTNALQEEIFLNISTGNNFFMVGDMKQSIYRFRRSDPEIFKSKSDAYKKEKNSANRKIVLSKNFRSRKCVLESINSVFNGIMSEEVGEIEYDEDQRLNFGDTPYSDENSHYPTGYKSECMIILSSDNDENEEITSTQLEARAIANKINELKDNNFKIRDKRKINEIDDDGNVIEKEVFYYRPIQNKDIAILMSSHKNIASIYQEELASFGIECFAQSSGYFEKTEITMALSLLKMINNPYNDLPLIAVMRSPIFSFTDDELCEIRLCKKDCFYNSLKYAKEFLQGELRDKCADLCKKIDKWRKYKKIMPCDKLIWTLYEETGLYSFCESLFGEDAASNLRLLFIRAKKYEESGYRGLFNFIRYINKLQKREEDLSSAVSLGENSDVVRLMTIHKSKGLEFPVVFLAGTSKKFRTTDSKGKILFHKDLGIGAEYINIEEGYYKNTLQKNAISIKISQESISEEVRKLYVGMTRAKEKLFISAVCKRKNTQEFGDEQPVELDNWKKMCDRSGVMITATAASVQRFIDWVAPVAIVDDENWCFDIIPNSDVKKYNFLFDDTSLTENNEEISGINISQKEYPFIETTNLPAKISVTQIDNIDKKSVNELVKVPAFLSTSTGINGARRGTAIHYVMQKYSPDENLSVDGIHNFITELVKNEELTLDEADSINPQIIYDFYKSDIGRRLLKSDRVFKEASFEIEIPLKEISPIQSDEKIMLQGIIDCYFYEGDEIVLVDYKTDSYADMNEIKEKYYQQLQLYTLAIEKITEKKVKNQIIYLFSANSVIQY